MNWMGETAPEEVLANSSIFHIWLLRVSQVPLVAGLLTVVTRPPAYPSKADCDSLPCQMIRLFWSSAAQMTWRETRRKHSTTGLESWLRPSKSPRFETSRLSPRGSSSSAAVSLATLPGFFTLKASASEPRSTHPVSRSLKAATNGHPSGAPLVDDPTIMHLPILPLLLFLAFARSFGIGYTIRRHVFPFAVHLAVHTALHPCFIAATPAIFGPSDGKRRRCANMIPSFRPRVVVPNSTIS